MENTNAMTQLRLTVLGSGTCVPAANRCSSGYWIDAGASRVRLDCGSGTVDAMARFDLPWKELTHQFISHFHLDHVGELAGLLFALKYGRADRRSAPLTLVGPAGLRALVERVAAAYGEALLEQEFPLVFTELEPDASLDLDGGAVLRVAKTPHTEESLAVRVEHGGRAIGYTGDTAPSPDLSRFFADVDVLVSECSFLEPNRAIKHLAADDVADLATGARARRLVATHCYFDPEAARLGERLAGRYAGPIDVARDGMTVEV
jgi:ribonuclease BN (tRNA processing enzyme)